MVEWTKRQDGWDVASWQQDGLTVDVAKLDRHWRLTVTGKWSRPFPLRRQTIETYGDIALTETQLRAVAQVLIAALAAVETTAAVPAERECCECGKVIGESGVLEDGVATCAACYLDRDAGPVVDGDVIDLTPQRQEGP